jgi:hypothetical protein
MRPWFTRRRCPVDASDRRLIRADSSWRLTSAPAAKKLSEMNRYGRQLMRQMQQSDPARFASLPDPDQHFTIVGEQLAVEIEQLAQSIAGPDRPGETYLEKVGRLNMARLAADARAPGAPVRRDRLRRGRVRAQARVWAAGTRASDAPVRRDHRRLVRDRAGPGPMWSRLSPRPILALLGKRRPRLVHA